MGENTLAVKVTADIVDLQTKFVTAKAEVSALTKEMNDLAKQSAAGILDPAGLAQLQDVSRQFLEAKQAAAELSQELKGTHESSVNLGEGLAEIRGQISNAFELTGIAAAYEGIQKVGEAVEQLGGRAIQMRAMSDVLGVSTDEFQAMSAAAEEGGTTVEIFARAQEKLISLMTQARDGSSAAADKLIRLGVATAQIYDPTTKVTVVLQTLKEGLENSATHQEIMNELTRDFGSKAILAAEAITKYDGSAAGIAATLARLNGLSTEQTAKLSELAVKWGELKTWMEDTASKALLAAEGFRELYVAYSRWAVAQVPSAVPALPQQQQGTIDRSSQQAAQQAAQTQMALDREIQQQEMENVKAGVEAFKQGSAEKLAAVREYATLAAQYYGSDEIDKVKAAKTAEIAEERAYNEAQASLRAESVRAEIKSDDDAAKARLSGIKLTIDANEQYFADAVKVHDAISSMEQTGLEFQTKIYQDRVKISAQITQLATKETKDQLAQWQALTNAMQSGFATAFKDMLVKGQSFGQGMRSMFASVADAAVNQAAKNISTMLEQAVVGKSLRSQEIRGDAGAAAAGAYKAVAGIPYVGPFLAPAAAAVAYAGVLAFDSAAGGYDVPAGLNPMTQLHSREMVLPRPIADTVRERMADGGWDRRGGRSGDTHVHMHMPPAADSKSFERMINNSQHMNTLAKTVRKAYDRNSPHLR